MKNKIIKRITKIIISNITLALALTGCSLLPSVTDNRSIIDTDSTYTSVGSCLTVHNTDERLTLLDNMDTLSSDGLYYASWTAGNAESYENSDKETVDLYDAQLYLLLGEYGSPETAQTNIDEWLEAGKNNYSVTAEETITCGEQVYTVITYDFVNEESPFARGVSAFGVIGSNAVCVELTCREQYDDDLKEMLITFLNGCSYS